MNETADTVHTENKMGTQPMGRILWAMGIPIIVSMILQACYNIVDSMFVSRMPDMNGLAHTGEYAMTYGVNIIFAGVSTAAVTAYGIFYKIQQFIFFAGFGLRDAITPLIAYNYGMGSYKRVIEGVRYGILDTSLIMIIGIIAMEVFAHPLAQIFGLSEHTEILCARAMRIIAPGFIFAGINISSQGIFQALEKGTYSLYVSLLRLVIVVLPLAYLFSIMESAEFLIWFAFPIAEAVAMLVAAFLLKRTRVQKIEPMRKWSRNQTQSAE
ncbi:MULTISPECIES: MATE family efflux transporter [unclassified Bilifractor]|uniref:MATE family efflux transporter n=1 Tax=unclassified Bilifractor TaxID=2815795 RepID=UPI003F93F7B6